MSATPGHKTLTPEQIENVNLIRGEGRCLDNLITILRENPEVDQRWLSIAATDLQKGLMALTRAVTKPDFF